MGMGTFSKTFCPGLRIGWLACSPDIMPQFVKVKQSADLHSSAFDQAIIDRYMDEFSLDEHVKEINALYGHRRDLIIQCMEKDVTRTNAHGRAQHKGSNRRNTHIGFIMRHEANGARQAFYLDKAKTQGKVDSASHQQHDSKGKRAQDRQGLIGMEHSRHVPEKVTEGADKLKDRIDPLKKVLHLHRSLFCNKIDRIIFR
ncbi:aminotransferase class I/II-fold pyridoxal phosphate-dependent enzyme [Acidaminococcus intestini]|uniref:aminotransferase class I/II-fold pyridoxal phosphate-dependent enzyme n=1 Tax=Acidaminococcus intestini TaxID=187327 RepID=UPI00374C89DC